MHRGMNKGLVHMRLAAAATVTSGLLALAACSDTTNVVAVKGALETQEEVDFRDVQVGIEMPYELVVKNVGDGSFSITGIEAGDGMCASDYEFKIDGSCEAQTLADESINLPAQTARTLRVTFQPFTAMENPVETSIRLLTNIKDDAGSNITFTVRDALQGFLDTKTARVSFFAGSVIVMVFPVRKTAMRKTTK